jgi:hypothetical protein
MKAPARVNAELSARLAASINYFNTADQQNKHSAISNQPKYARDSDH